jgi:hypothetical protein
MNKKIACSLSLVLAGVAQIASARPMLIDFGDNFDLNGSSWPNDTFDDQLNVENNGVANGSLGTYFNLSYGGTTFTNFCMSENGVFALSAASGCGQADDLVISVLGNDWVSDSTAFATNEGSVSFSTGGLIDLTAPYNQGEAQKVIRFLWNDLLLSPDVGGDGITRYGFQALFFERSDGGFDLQLNYGHLGNTDPFPGVQSITFGNTTLFEGAPPFLTANNYDFSFVGDTFTVGGTPPQTSVPEPATLSLLSAGLGMLGLSALRRRRSTRGATA